MSGEPWQWAWSLPRVSSTIRSAAGEAIAALGLQMVPLVVVFSVNHLARTLRSVVKAAKNNLP
jgi:hypothetical protein